MAMSKVKMDKPAKVECITKSKNEEWDDKILPHVLEAYGLPADYTCEDVMHVLAKYDCADVTLHAVGEQHYLVVFSSPSAGNSFLFVCSLDVKSFVNGEHYFVKPIGKLENYFEFSDQLVVFQFAV